MTHQTSSADADQIVTTSITSDAPSLPPDALKDDDQRWIETVRTSLKGRSDEVREALLKALLDGEPCGNPAGLTTFLIRAATSWHEAAASPLQHASHVQSPCDHADSPLQPAMNPAT